ncbi:MarR family transcriptional regulator [Paraburkholderia sediminicola]|uniref:MarR family winged helix-turn-helix transcriptional regulator n=1 Tax=Paraburkholderia sediminicola TaxID=458836 RepID=UPI0038BDDE2A
MKNTPQIGIDTIDAVARAHRRAASMSLGDTNIGILIRLNHGFVMDWLNRHLAPFGVTNVCYFTMVMLYSTPDNLANPSDLCRATGETRGNMTRICDELVEKGLIQRITNADDRRRVDLSLTDEGIAMLRQIVPKLRKEIAGVYKAFTEEEKSTLVGLLTKLNQAFVANL